MGFVAVVKMQEASCLFRCPVTVCSHRGNNRPHKCTTCPSFSFSGLMKRQHIIDSSLLKPVDGIKERRVSRVHADRAQDGYDRDDTGTGNIRKSRDIGKRKYSARAAKIDDDACTFN